MGKHSSREQWPFFRSVIVWFLPWVIIAALLGAAVIFAVNTLSDDGLTTPPPAADDDDRRDKERETEAPDETPPPTEAEKTPGPDETAEPTPTPTPEVELITEGITVQVLNASPSEEADEAVATRLEDAGFSIVSFAAASTQYEQTTVFWATDEFKKAAKAMAAEFGWVAEAQPGNLSTTVSIHVVVGADEAG